jgi:hypothetical protein
VLANWEKKGGYAECPLDAHYFNQGIRILIKPIEKEPQEAPSF